VSVTIAGSKVSGLVITDASFAEGISGAVSQDGLVSGNTADVHGNLTAIFTGTLAGNAGSGQWVDVYGCYGTFRINRQ